MNILLFESSKEVRSSLVRNIEAIAYNINVEAVSGIDDTIDLIKSQSFDLTIIDMDYLYGRFREIISLLRQNNPDAAIILLTLFPNIDIMRKFMSNGADFCFDKIGQFEEILEKIRSLMETQHSVNSRREMQKMFQIA